MDKTKILLEYDSLYHNFKIFEDGSLIITELYKENPNKIQLVEDETHALSIHYQTEITQRNLKRN